MPASNPSHGLRGVAARLRARWNAAGTGLRAALVVGTAAVLVSAVVAAIGRVAEYDEVLAAVRSADPRWLAVCFVAELAAYAGYILCFRAAAAVRGGPLPSIGVTTRAIFVAFGAFAAANAAGGLATDYWILRETGETGRDALRRLLCLNVLLYVSFGAIVLVSAALVLGGRGGDVPLEFTLGWMAFLLSCVAAMLVLTRPAASRWLTDPRDGGRIRRGVGHAVAAVFLARDVVRQRRYAAGAIGAPLHWAGDIACLWAALHAFDVELPLVATIVAYATAFVVTLVPLPAGGAGAIDASLAFTLAAVGAPLAAALPATLAYRFFSFWLEIPPALLSLPKLPALRRELASAPREPLGPDP
jgi:uncharacterized membrane protein YbhN (UPF0104 family)